MDRELIANISSNGSRFFSSRSISLRSISLRSISLRTLPLRTIPLRTISLRSLSFARTLIAKLLEIKNSSAPVLIKKSVLIKKPVQFSDRLVSNRHAFKQDSLESDNRVLSYALFRLFSTRFNSLFGRSSFLFSGFQLPNYASLPALALFSVLALTSCSFIEGLAKIPQNLIMAEEETKQGKERSSAPASNYLSDTYLRQALSKTRTEKVTSEYLKLIKIDHKYKWLSGFDALGVTVAGEVLLVSRDGRLVPIPLPLAPTQAAAYSQSTQRIAFARSDGVSLIDLTSGQEVAKLTKLRARINSIDFDAAGEGVLLGTTDNKVYRWRYQNERSDSSLREREQALERYVGHSSVISQVCFHPKGRVFFSADWLGKVLAWVRYDADGFDGEYLTNAVSGRPFTAEVQLAKASFQADGSVEALRVNESGELLAISSDKGQLALVMVRGFRMLAKTQAHSGLIYDLDYSPDGQSAVTIGRDNKLKVWRVRGLDLDSIDPTEASLQLVFESEVVGAYKVVFIDSDRVLVGLKSGEVKHISIQPQLPEPVGPMVLHP